MKGRADARKKSLLKFPLLFLERDDVPKEIAFRKLWFDIENDSYKASRIPGWPNAAVISRHCAIFCDKVAAAGYHTGIYTSYYWFQDYVKGLNRYDKRTAHWGYNDGSWAVNLNGECNIHQFTSIPMDRNVFYTDPNLMSNDD